MSLKLSRASRLLASWCAAGAALGLLLFLLQGYRHGSSTATAINEIAVVDAIPIYYAQLSADQMVLTVRFPGGPQGNDVCSQSYSAVIAERVESVTVTVRSDRSTPATIADGTEIDCGLVAHERTTTVRLEAPLGDRQLIDGALGRSIQPRPSTPVQTTSAPSPGDLAP